MTKIDIISGFLGAGKTTLIKKLVKEELNKEKLVLIENEFGEIGIDGGFLQDAGIEIKEMNQGCICCSLVGDFGTSLKEVIATYEPERIVIEPSGVGKLSDVVKAVTDLDIEVVLNSAIVVVDATKCKMYMKNFGEFYLNQITNAGTIILSRTDKLSEVKLKECVDMMRQHNASAYIITTPWDELHGSHIMKTVEGNNNLMDALLEEVSAANAHHDHEHHEHHEGCSCGHDHGHEDHEHENHDHLEHHEGCGCGHDHHEHEHHDHDNHEHHEGCGCGHDHHEHEHHHSAEEVFTSWGKESTMTYDEATVMNILNQLDHQEEYGIVLRAKGIVPGKEGKWIHFDYVYGDKEVREGSPDVIGKVCVIGSNIQSEKLDKLFV